MPLPRDAKACQRVLERAKGATVACVTLLVLAVLCLLTGGSYHWNRAAVALREAKLDKYHGAVEAWTRSERRRFQQLGRLGVSLRMVQSMAVGPSELLFNGTLEASTEPDRFRDPEASQLPTYEPLRYVFNAQTERAVELPWKAWTAVVEISYQDAEGALQTLALPVELTRATDVACSGWKTSSFKAQAASVASRCLVYQKAAAVCLRLYHPEPGRWQLRGGPEGAGCQAPAWAPVTYEHVELERYHPPTTVTLELPFPVTVRASTDPWEVASALTAGSLNFGITQREHDNIVRLLFVAAVGCLGAAVALLACCATECGYYDGGDEPLIHLDAAASYNSPGASINAYGDSLSPESGRPKKKKSTKHVVLSVDAAAPLPSGPPPPQATSTAGQLWPSLGVQGSSEEGDHEMAIAPTSG